MDFNIWKKIKDYYYRNFKNYCLEHGRDLEVWSHGQNKWEYGMVKYIECRECHPDLFDPKYFENLKRFNLSGFEKTLTKK